MLRASMRQRASADDPRENAHLVECERHGFRRSARAEMYPAHTAVIAPAARLLDVDWPAGCDHRRHWACCPADPSAVGLQYAVGKQPEGSRRNN